MSCPRSALSLMVIQFFPFPNHHVLGSQRGRPLVLVPCTVKNGTPASGNGVLKLIYSHIIMDLVKHPSSPVSQKVIVCGDQPFKYYVKIRLLR